MDTAVLARQLINYVINLRPVFITMIYDRKIYPARTKVTMIVFETHLSMQGHAKHPINSLPGNPYIFM